jgi:hypothetical protein
MSEVAMLETQPVVSQVLGAVTSRERGVFGDDAVRADLGCSIA